MYQSSMQARAVILGNRESLTNSTNSETMCSEWMKRELMCESGSICMAGPYHRRACGSSNSAAALAWEYTERAEQTGPLPDGRVDGSRQPASGLPRPLGRPVAGAECVDGLAEAQEAAVAAAVAHDAQHHAAPAGQRRQLPGFLQGEGEASR
jgi:hypothetical protein